MAVEIATSVRRARYQGSTDPALPTGSWFAQVGVAGDASGGAHTLLFRFGAAGIRDTNMYSVEKLMGSIGAAAPVNAMLAVVNMGQEPDVSDQFQSYDLFYNDNGVGITPRVSIDPRSLLFLPLWLGEKQTLSVDAQIRIEITNTDTVVSTIRMEGYIWSARSVLADGGPRRPPGSRYG